MYKLSEKNAYVQALPARQQHVSMVCSGKPNAAWLVRRSLLVQAACLKLIRMRTQQQLTATITPLTCMHVRTPHTARVGMKPARSPSHKAPLVTRRAHPCSPMSQAMHLYALQHTGHTGAGAPLLYSWRPEHQQCAVQIMEHWRYVWQVMHRYSPAHRGQEPWEKWKQCQLLQLPVCWCTSVKVHNSTPDIGYREHCAAPAKLLLVMLDFRACTAACPDWICKARLFA